MNSLIVSSVVKKMAGDGESLFPDECCGFLFGTESSEQRTILESRAVVNSKEGDKRRRFEITGTDYLKAEQYAEEKGYSLLGIYHSHPQHPAIPSEQDRIAAQPYFSYIILSILDGEFADLRSWRLNDLEQFDEEILEEILLNNKIQTHGNSDHSNSIEKIHE